MGQKWSLTSNKLMALWLIVLPHSVLGIYVVLHNEEQQANLRGVIQFLVILFIVLGGTYISLKINIFLYSRKEIENSRLRILMGGRRLLFYALYTMIMQVGFYILFWKLLHSIELSTYLITMDVVLTIGFIIGIYLNGFIRVFALSRRLTIFTRVFSFFIMWIPGLNLLVLLFLAHQAIAEFDHECYKVDKNQQRVDSAICQTKHPIVLLHGVGFRDLKYFNYWGRIPNELIRNGATIHYGHQEAWGTIESNAAAIKEKIHWILETTGHEKVNIIAHSKGGLDARYMISQLEMADKVASLTTISTPHRGSEVIDFVYRLPSRFVTFVGRQMDRYFRLIGDRNPDFATASKQFLTYNSHCFNESVIDVESVYYQSYASVMNSFLSDYILWFPYLLVYGLGGKNDGLVTVDSAKWGEFKGTIKSKSLRGISHGDVIDLRRHEYKGFDIREHYVSVVAELKELGF